MSRKAKAEAPPPEPVARPFLKWAGGKRSLSQAILERLPKSAETYFEPFLGGGAVFFALAQESPPRAARVVLGDDNKEIMRAFQAVRDEWPHVVKELRELEGKTTRADYEKVRASNPSGAAERAARTIYLNRLGFNGLYRVNRAGQFNVPYGRYKNPRVLDEENLRQVSRVLQGARLMRADFADLLEMATAKDMVYLDPPYLPRSKTSQFSAYVPGGFGLAEQVRLRDVCRKLQDQGIPFVLSQADVPLARELYDEETFEVEVVQAARNINSVGTGRGKVTELLIQGRR